jgi:uncharacterized phage protein (TIGR01671 family)
MNREMKFRVWNKNSQSFIPQDDIAVTNQGGILTYDCHHDYKKSWGSSFDNVVVQQYTGLKDKNGTPIYEGDILVADHDGSAGEANIGVVYFAAGTYMIDGDGPLYEHVYGHSPDILDNHTVIGNKFENSELLKQNE